MEKRGLIVLLILSIIILVTSVDAKIVWTTTSGASQNPGAERYCVFVPSGEVTTTETSRTQEATSQAYDAIFVHYQDKWVQFPNNILYKRWHSTSGCYRATDGCDDLGVDFYRKVCTDGTWSCDGIACGAHTGQGTWQIVPDATPCQITSASISSNCAGGSSADCEQGETITMSVSYSGSCSSSTIYQIDATNDANCNIQASGGTLSGITRSISTPATSGSATATWTIPSIPSSCQGKTIYPNAAALWNGNPGTGTQVASTSSVSGSFRFYTPAATPLTISFTRTPSGSLSSPYKAGDTVTANFLISPPSPQSAWQKDWTFRSTTTDTVTGSTTNNPDFIAGWADINAQGWCTSNGICSTSGTWQASQFNCGVNVNNVRRVSETVTINGYTSNTNSYYFRCSDAPTCKSNSVACSSNSECCSGYCASSTNMCAALSGGTATYTITNKKSVYDIGDTITWVWSLPSYAYDSRAPCTVWWYVNGVPDNVGWDGYVYCGDPGLIPNANSGTLTNAHCYGKSTVTTNTVQIIIKDSQSNTITQSNSDSYTIDCAPSTGTAVSGYVRTSTGAGVSGVTISAIDATSTGSCPFSPSATASATTDSSGYYSFNFPSYSAPCDYIAITPSKSGCTFSPTLLRPQNTGTPATNQNFVATCSAGCTNDCSSVNYLACIGSTNYHMCGYFDADSCLDWGSTMTCTNPFVCVADSNPTGGLACTNCKSTSQSCANYWECCSGTCSGGFCQAAPSGTTISGYVRDGSSVGISGATVSASWGCFYGPAAGSVSATTSSTGYYSINVNWGQCKDANVYAQKNGCTFTPANQLFQNMGSSVSQNFVGTCAAATCTDSDGGHTYNTIGTTSGIQNWDPFNQGSHTDYCESSTSNLIEFYCVDTQRYYWERYPCPYGCNNGACSGNPSVDYYVSGQVRYNNGSAVYCPSGSTCLWNCIGTCAACTSAKGWFANGANGNFTFQSQSGITVCIGAEKTPLTFTPQTYQYTINSNISGVDFVASAPCTPCSGNTCIDGVSYQQCTGSCVSGVVNCPSNQNCSSGSCVNCVSEGGSLGAVIPGNYLTCCSGLTAINTSVLTGTTCQDLVGSRGYCTNCGDGNCVSPENSCNCPLDCGVGGCLPNELCDNGIDDDCDTFIDCDDSTCSSNSACQNCNAQCSSPVCKPTSEICDNGLDDDCDSLTDCDDSSCSSDSACQSCNTQCSSSVCKPSTELCDNNLDDDCDNLVDCDDSSCSSNSACQSCNAQCSHPVCKPETEACNNGLDDDCDGSVDCDDSSCSSNSACQSCNPQCSVIVCRPDTELCDNNLDDDCDGLPDCLDSGCSSQASCQSCDPSCSAAVCKPGSEVCDNTLDDDCDGLTDCADTPCSSACPPCPSGQQRCPDGTCSENCIITGDTHTECVNSECVVVQGAGVSQCLPVGSSCNLLPQNHSECVGGLCGLFSGSGTNLCFNDNNCNEPAAHTECRTNVCTEVQGAGVSQCLPVGSSCTLPPVNHTGCLNAVCTLFESAGIDTCFDNTVCASGVTHNECMTGLCVEVTGPGADQCTPSSSCLVESHTECVDGSCILVQGAGVSQCLPFGASCSFPPQSHAECVDGMCVLVASSGTDSCTSDNSCNNPPAHTSCVNSKCEVIDGAGVSECLAVNSSCISPPEDSHAECIGGNCVVVDGQGSNTCSVNDDCKGVQCEIPEDCPSTMICGSNGICGCPEGTDLCSDGTCGNPCGAPVCDKDTVCEVGESCGCEDCHDGDSASCDISSSCLNGVCEGCSLVEAKWLGNCGLEGGKEICVVPETESIDLYASGTGSCVGRVFDFSIFLADDSDEEVMGVPGVGIFIDGNVTTFWDALWIDASTFGGLFGSENPVYSFYVSSAGIDTLYSTNFLKVCRGDGDCDGVGDDAPDDCKDTPYGNVVNERGCDPEQEACITSIDCSAVSWSECSEQDRRTRNICKVAGTNIQDPDGDPNVCCNEQSTCMCNLGTCTGHSNWIPTERKCLIEEDFPFFSAVNVLVVISILLLYYFFVQTKRRR